MDKSDKGEDPTNQEQDMIDLYKMKIANEKAELVYAVLDEIEKVLVITKSFTEKMGDVSKIEAVYENLETLDKVVANLSDIQKVDGFKSEVEKLVGVITPLKTELLTLKDDMLNAKETTITAKDSIVGVKGEVEAIKTELSGYNENFTNSLNAAKLSEQNAKQSEVNAKQSETNAKQSEINAKAVENKADEAIATAQTIQTLASGVTQNVTKATTAATNAKASEQTAYAAQVEIMNIKTQLEAKLATMASGKKTALFLHKGEYDASKYVELPFNIDGKKRQIGRLSDVLYIYLGYTDGYVYFSSTRALYKAYPGSKTLVKVFDYPVSESYNWGTRIGDKMYLMYVKPSSGSSYYKYIYEVDPVQKKLIMKQSNASWLNADDIAFLGVYNGEIYFSYQTTAPKKPIYAYNVETNAARLIDIDLTRSGYVLQYLSFVYKNKIYIHYTDKVYQSGTYLSKYNVAIFNPEDNSLEFKQDMYSISVEWSLHNVTLINGKVYGMLAHSRQSGVYDFDFIYDLETGEKTTLNVKSQLPVTNDVPKMFADELGWVYTMQQMNQQAENPGLSGVKVLAELP